MGNVGCVVYVYGLVVLWVICCYNLICYIELESGELVFELLMILDMVCWSIMEFFCLVFDMGVEQGYIFVLLFQEVEVVFFFIFMDWCIYLIMLQLDLNIYMLQMVFIYLDMVKCESEVWFVVVKVKREWDIQCVVVV